MKSPRREILSKPHSSMVTTLFLARSSRFSSCMRCSSYQAPRLRSVYQTRVASTLDRPSTSTKTPVFSPGEDNDELNQELQPLLTSGQWKLTGDGMGLEKTFKFKGFKAAFYEFMTPVAAECVRVNHHPEWQNVRQPNLEIILMALTPFADIQCCACAVRNTDLGFGKEAKYRDSWTTHRPLGLSAKDVTMAKVCDAQAEIAGVKKS
jgi:4a-hydroxytetrahydrobiopterin dehydratase